MRKISLPDKEDSKREKVTAEEKRKKKQQMNRELNL